MMIKIIKYIIRKVRIVRKIHQIDVAETGIDKDGDAYIKLNSGRYFFGPQPLKKEKKFYRYLLNRRRKKQIPFYCFQIAIDIVIRYMEGNLMWGGPSKEAYYKIRMADTVVEMGAFRGYYTIYIADQVGESGTVIAIEPIAENLKYLKKNIKINNMKNVKIVEKGVWNKNEVKYFNRKPTDYQSGSIDITYSNNKSEAVEVNTLDKILEDTGIETVNFMLIQLNGAEYEALEGLTKIKPQNLAIAARYNKNSKNIAEMITHLLHERNYETKVIDQKFIYASIVKK